MFNGPPLCSGSGIATRSGTAPAAYSSGQPSTAEIFSKFFEHWLQQQYQDLDSLRFAVDHNPSSGDEVEDEEEEGRRLCPLIDGVISHYDNYYRHKSTSAKQDVLPMFTPSWTTSTENLFLWAGGWRPSMAFHLLYSKSGLQLESQLDRIISGLRTRDLVDLSPQQLDQIDRLHRETIRAEREISEEEARAQETVADARMVELAGAMTEMGRRGGDREGVEMMGPEMERKEQGMERVLERADRLRMETLRGVVEIMRPVQRHNSSSPSPSCTSGFMSLGRRKTSSGEPGAHVS